MCARRALPATDWLTALVRAWAGWRPLTHSYRRRAEAEQPGVPVSPVSARRGVGTCVRMRRDHDGRAVHCGFGFVVDERLVGGGLDDTINTVDRLLPGLTIEHFTRQTAGSATAAPSFIHCGIQGLSHQSLIRPRAERDHSTRFGQPDPLPAPRLINPFSGPICEGPRIRDWRLCSTP